MTSPENRPGAERIAPTPLQRPPDRAAPPRTAAAAARDRPLFWAAVLAIAVLLSLVVLWLPSQVAGPRVSESAPAVVERPPPAEAGEPALAPVEVDTEDVLQRRQAAQRLADALQLRRAELEKLAVERWAEADYRQVTVNDERARGYFEQREFEAAATYWQKAIAGANTLLGQVEPLLKTTVGEGYRALQEGDSEAAIEAFDLALAIHPENPAAQAGMRRARALPQLLTLLAAAENHERADRVDQAMMLYREALSLDPQSREAKAGAIRMAEQMQDWEFRITLSTAQQALDEGEFATAKREFLKAEKIKPGQTVVKEGLAQAEVGLQQQEIQRLSRRAEAAEQAENWQQARDDYQRLLALEGTMEFARQGLARSRARLALDQRLGGLLAQPERLFSEAVRDEARGLLTEARAVANPGARLREQVQKLQRALELASREVAVTLVSDNQTQVMVYRVGKLGQFDQKELQLTPGDYVLVGRCEGYRDARKTLSVRPGMDRVGPVDIRCTEKI